MGEEEEETLATQLEAGDMEEPAGEALMLPLGLEHRGADASIEKPGRKLECGPTPSTCAPATRKAEEEEDVSCYQLLLLSFLPGFTR